MAITAESVRFGYRGTEVIRGASFAVPEGAITCLLGRNGSGKTTLIRLVNGILRPQSGSIRIGDLDVLQSPRPAVARQVAFVPQEHQGVFPYGVEELVVMGRNPHLGLIARPGAGGPRGGPRGHGDRGHRPPGRTGLHGDQRR